MAIFSSRLKMATKLTCSALFASVPVLATLSLPAAAEDQTPASHDDAVQVTIETACSFSAEVTSEHTATLTPGVLTEGIGTTAFNGTCNDARGMAIYMIGYTNDKYGDNKLRAQDDPDQYIETGTATSGDKSQWAVKLAASTTAGGDSFDLPLGTDYFAVPHAYTKVASFDGATDPAGLNFTSTYRGYSAGMQYPGLYKAQVRFTMVHPNIPEGFGDLHFMQDMTPEVCANAKVDDTIQLRDARDGKWYWVTKLKDGNCWMTQNLDLDLNEATLPLTPATSDVSADWTPTSTFYTRTTINNSTSATDMHSWDFGDYKYDGTTNNSCGTSAQSYADCLSGHGISTANATDSEIASSGTLEQRMEFHRHVGNLYQYATATAGSGNNVTAQGANATDSICPKGWELPKNTGSKSFINLQSAGGLGSTVQKWLDAPYYFNRSGYVDSGTLRNVGYSSYAWSATSISESKAYYLGLSDVSYVRPQNEGTRAIARPVRCVAR